MARAARESIDDGAFAPELCRSLAAPPAGDGWLHETKWDGYRILASVKRGKVRLWSRNGIEWTHKLPELVEAVASLGCKAARLDGEMVVLRKGRDDFNALQARLSARKREPAVYVLFDLLHLDGRGVHALPLVERKRLLADLLEGAPHTLLKFSNHVVGQGARVFAAASKAGLEGIVSKRVDSVYRGTRSGDWVKIKARPSDEFAIVGFTEPKGSRQGIGALLLARRVRGAWVYCGRVGTGLKDAELQSLRGTLDKARVQKPPADIALLARRDVPLARWVRPTLVVEVFHQGIGSQGLLRQAAFKALRHDKRVRDL